VAEGKPNAREQELSFEIAVILMLTYVLSLVFTLKTHKHLYAGGHGDDADDAIGTEGWSIGKASPVLLVATAFVAVMSEFLVGAVQATARPGA
jgi:Ca2+:H+ antiporter